MAKRRNFEGRTVLVTGAAGGLGAALCERFGAAGARVGALDSNAPGLERLRTRLDAFGIEAATEICDITDREAVVCSVRGLERDLGPCDVLVNNAGITHRRSFDATQTEAVRRVMEVNFQGAVHCTAAAFDSLLAQRGLIIVISSVAGFAPLVGRTAYSASKHALHGFFDSLRAELRPQGVGVLVVCPAFVATAIRDTSGDPEDQPQGFRVIGPEATPEWVAGRIFTAAVRGQESLTTGSVGHVARWLQRLVPGLYERLMVRTAGPGPPDLDRRPRSGG